MSDLDKSSIPSIDFNNDTVLVYFLEQLEQEVINIKQRK
jgi:hypothetical protein